MMRQGKVFLAMLSAAVFFFLVCSSMQGATLVVGKDGWQPFTTIQSAVDMANDGDVIKITQGVYAEQVEVRDLSDVLIEGDQAILTVPAGGMVGSILKVVNCEEVHITGLTIDGKCGQGVGYGARNSGGDTDTRFNGIFLVNSSAHIVKNTIKDVSWGNGVQQGLGIYVYVDDGMSRDVNIRMSRDVNIRENTVTNFQKNGITIYGPVKAKVHKNTVTGWGDTDVIAQNCIQLGGDPEMTASVTSNIISKSNYTPMTWASTGILVIFGSDNIRLVRNTISETMIGIYVYPGSTNCKIINNSGSGNTWDYYSYDSTTKTHANKFED
jgi:parallel beta-helix repeat protein